MVNCAVLRDASGNIIGVMRGDYALMPNWVQEDDIGQNPPPSPPPPPTKRIIVLKDITTGLTTPYQVLSDQMIPV